MKEPIAAVILAAGMSTRAAPGNKLLAPMSDGCALIRDTVRHVLASKATPVIVVTGFQAPLITAALAGLPVRFVHAPDYSDGLAASLRCGVAMLPSETRAGLITLGDMPLVATPMLNKILAGYDPQAGHDIVVPVWKKQRGNPRLWGRPYFDALQSLSGDAGANKLLENYPNRIAEISAADDSVLRDFDTKAALLTLSAAKV